VQETLTAALEREHHEIDAGLGAFVDGLDSGELRGAELGRAADALRRHIYLEAEFVFPPPGTAAGTAQDRCRELLAQRASHNAKEEPIIYPQGDAVLGDEAKAELHEFIDSGRMPLGWVCAQARPRG
jgi:hypothetical protein